MNKPPSSPPEFQAGNIKNLSSTISSVCIIGEGKMGTNIFYYLVGFGFRLVWLVSRDADTEKLRQQFTRKINRSFEAGIIGKEAFDILEQTVISASPEAVADCDLIIETITENPELKLDLFLELDAIANQACIFSSNSSSVKPFLLSPGSERRKRFIGMHFFYPVALKNIVEVTFTTDTCLETRMVVESFLNNIRRRFITLDENNSFILNKIFLDVQNEAFLIVQKGHCSYIQIDQLVKTYLFPFGIFDFFDGVGLETMLCSIRNYIRDYPHKSCYSQLIETLSNLVSKGSLGMKTQKGFYNYPKEELAADEPINSAEIVDHLRQTWISSAKSFFAQAHIPVDDANHAIKEYFDISKGPFE